MKHLPQYTLVLAAAYSVRGLAYETKGDLAQASRDYQLALGLLPTYEVARLGAARVGSGRPDEERVDGAVPER